MGNFANTLFSVLLGWVQSATAWLWSLITSDGADGLMGWVLDNWLALAVGLCLLGLAVDGIVYLIRWQPYRVWRSFLSGGGDGSDPEADEPLEQGCEDAGETESRTGEAHGGGLLRRVIPARNRAQQDCADTEGVSGGYHQPYYPPQWNGGRTRRTDGGAPE